VGGNGANEPAPEGGVGGYPDEVRASAEVWDPATASFGPAGSLEEARQQHTATHLHDGRVLVVGGSGVEGEPVLAEVWDPATTSFSPAGSLIVSRASHTATLLDDGRVLVIGGIDPDAAASTELWDPTTTSFSQAGRPTEARSWHAATGLPDRRVLVIGGMAVGESDRGLRTSAEVWDSSGG
jgi:hypothetical protein